MLVRRGHGEVLEHHDEDEQVVDRKRFLDDEPGEKLERHAGGGALGVESGESHQPVHLRQAPARVEVEAGVEQERQSDPDRAPAECLARRNDVRLAMEHAQVEREHPHHEQGEERVEPPILAEGKKDDVVHGCGLA